MFKKLIFGLLISVFYLTLSYAADENITITTYYPSPYGSYRDLRITNNLTLQAEPINNDGPQIQWRTAATGRHWNIDQVGDRLRFFTEDSNNGTGAVRVSVEENGNMGIGGSNSTAGRVLMLRDATIPAIALSTSGTDNSGVIEYNNASGQLRFQSWNNNADTWLKTMMVVDSDNGNIGVGTDDPQVRLDIGGTGLLKLGNRTGDPTEAKPEGSIYYNASSDKVKVNTSSGWQNVGGQQLKIATDLSNAGSDKTFIEVGRKSTRRVSVPGINVRYVILGGGWNHDSNWSGRHGCFVLGVGNEYFDIKNGDGHDETVINWMAIGD